MEITVLVGCDLSMSVGFSSKGMTIDNIPPGLETSKRPWLQAGFATPSITRQVSLGETRLTTGKRFFLKMFWKPTVSFEANWLFIVRTVEKKLNARS